MASKTALAIKAEREHRELLDRIHAIEENLAALVEAVEVLTKRSGAPTRRASQSKKD